MLARRRRDMARMRPKLTSKISGSFGASTSAVAVAKELSGHKKSARLGAFSLEPVGSELFRARHVRRTALGGLGAAGLASVARVLAGFASGCGLAGADGTAFGGVQRVAASR